MAYRDLLSCDDCVINCSVRLYTENNLYCVDNATLTTSSEPIETHSFKDKQLALQKYNVIKEMILACFHRKNVRA